MYKHMKNKLTAVELSYLILLTENLGLHGLKVTTGLKSKESQAPYEQSFHNVLHVIGNKVHPDTMVIFHSTTSLVDELADEIQNVRDLYGLWPRITEVFPLEMTRVLMKYGYDKLDVADLQRSINSNAPKHAKHKRS